MKLVSNTMSAEGRKRTVFQLCLLTAIAAVAVVSGHLVVNSRGIGHEESARSDSIAPPPMELWQPEPLPAEESALSDSIAPPPMELWQPEPLPTEESARPDSIAPPPVELWQPEPLPANVEIKAGCIVPKTATEVTGAQAVSKGQRVFDAGGVVVYARPDGTCVSLVKGDTPPPEFVPDDIAAVSAEEATGE